MNLTNQGLADRAQLWRDRQPKLGMADRANEQELDGLLEVHEKVRVAFEPEGGRTLDLSQFVGVVFGHRSPLIIHLYFKSHTPALRCINVRADQEVGDRISAILENRYPPRSYSIEFYGRDAKLGMTSMCLIIKEGPFCKGTSYRDETLQTIDEDLATLEF